MYRDENVDNELKNLLNENNKIPESIKLKKESAFAEIRKTVINKEAVREKSYMKKKKVGLVAAVLAGVLLVGTPIVAAVRGVLLDGKYQGIQKAVEKGYVQNVEGVFAEDKGIKMELTNVVSDPTAISLRFKISAENKNDIKKLGLDSDTKGRVAFNIIDDKGRVIEGYDPEEGSYTVPIKGENEEDIWLTSGGDNSVDTSNISNGEIYYDYMINSTEGNLKDIKGLSIEVVKLGKLKGNWKMNVDFTEEMMATNVVTYEATEKNDKVEVIEAKQMATGLMVTFAVKPGLDENIILYTKIEDMQGNRYSTERAASMEVLEDGRDKVVMTFDISKFNSLEEFYLVVENFEGVDQKVKMKIKK